MLRKFACMLAVSAVSLAAGQASANGQLIVAYDAKSLGMGLTGTAWVNNSAAAYANPAGLGGVKHVDLLLALSPSLSRARGPYAVESGGGSLSIVNTTSRAMLTPLGMAGITYRPHKVIALNVSAGVTEVEGATFDDVPLSLITGAPSQTNRGQATQGSLVWDARANVALNVLPWLTIGGGYRAGWVHAQQQLASNDTVSYKAVENGHNYQGGTAGIIIKPHRQVRIGGSFRSRLNQRATLKINDEDRGSVSVIDPHQFTAGIAWQLAGNRVMLAADYKHWFYDDAQKAVNPAADVVKDAMSGHIGAEVLVTPMVPLRFGFLVGTSRTKDSAAFLTRTPPGLVYGGTVGTGVRFEKADLDLAFGYGAGASSPNSAPIKGKYGVEAWLIQASMNVHI